MLFQGFVSCVGEAVDILFYYNNVNPSMASHNSHLIKGLISQGNWKHLCGCVCSLQFRVKHVGCCNIFEKARLVCATWKPLYVFSAIWVKQINNSKQHYCMGSLWNNKIIIIFSSWLAWNAFLCFCRWDWRIVIAAPMTTHCACVVIVRLL